MKIRDIDFDVEISRKRIKNMYLRLDGNTIRVSCPLRMPEYEVYRFIGMRKDWIMRNYCYQEYRKEAGLKYQGGETFHIFGKPYRLIRMIGKKDVRITEDEIYLSYKDDPDDALRYLYKQLDRKLLAEADILLDKHLRFLEDYGYMLKPELNCRLMTSRWGVCYTRKNRISISSYLIHYPLYCLEYIMVHEMTHFIIPNHSRRFHDIVARNMPDYKKAHERLKI